MKKQAIAVLILFLAGFGCAPRQQPAPMPILTAPVMPDPEPYENPGSLFSASEGEYLYDDARARRIGDIVMVVVSENSSATTKADTTAQRETDMNFAQQTMQTGGLVGAIPFAGKVLGGNSGTILDGTHTNDFKSTGETKREGDFSATVAARIVRKLPGGVLQVEGARRIRVNDETQILVVRGLVRQKDIASDNTVPSSNLAEAQIDLYGEGVLGDKQSPGWLSRILDNVWPF